MKWALVFLVSFPATADVSVVIGGWSHHSAGEWNERNQTLGLEYALDIKGWQAILTGGAYTDSRSRDASYAGVGLMKPLWVSQDWKLSTGAYLLHFESKEIEACYACHVRELPDGSRQFYSTMPVPGASYDALIPGITLQYKMAGVNLAVMPPNTNVDVWTTALQLKMIF